MAGWMSRVASSFASGASKQSETSADRGESFWLREMDASANDGVVACKHGMPLFIAAMAQPHDCPYHPPCNAAFAMFCKALAWTSMEDRSLAVRWGRANLCYIDARDAIRDLEGIFDAEGPAGHKCDQTVQLIEVLEALEQPVKRWLEAAEGLMSHDPRTKSSKVPRVS